MQVEVKVDENCKATRIIIVTDKMTEEINEIIKRLSDEQPKMIAGFKAGEYLPHLCGSRKSFCGDKK